MGRSVKEITVENVEHIAFRLARDRLSFDEPIPDFGTRYPHRLESCLLTPFQGAGDAEFYPSLTRKAAILFYLMIKNHPFQNGNKRIAVTALLTFLFLNDKWLTVEPHKLLNVTTWVAQSLPQFRRQVVEALEKFIKDHLVPREPPQAEGS